VNLKANPKEIHLAKDNPILDSVVVPEGSEAAEAVSVVVVSEAAEAVSVVVVSEAAEAVSEAEAADLDDASMMVHAKCIRLHALNVRRNVKFLSSQPKVDQFIVKTVLPLNATTTNYYE
jgi:hypothetical protein